LLYFFVGKLLIINIMKSLAAAALSMSLGFAGADAMASEPGHHAHAAVSVGAEASAHHGALQLECLGGLGSGFEAGAALSTGLNVEKDMLFGAEVVGAYQRGITDKLGIMFKLAAGMEAVRNSVHGMHFGPSVKGALLGELGLAKDVKAYAGPYAGSVGGHAQVGGVAGVTVGF
jgi:hypothetical protein